MAPDSVKRFGRNLRQSYKEIDHTKRKVAETLPKIERVVDIFMPSDPFRIEFYAGESNTARLNLIIKQAFDPTMVANAFVPLTISETGLPIGKAGSIIACGFPYQIAYMGDLNLENVSNTTFRAVFDYTSYGSRTLHFQIKWGSDQGSGRVMDDVTTFGGGKATVPISASILGLSSTTILRDVYVYVWADGCSGGSWTYLSAVTFYMGPSIYTPRKAV